jgi:hypothetical protein
MLINYHMNLIVIKQSLLKYPYWLDFIKQKAMNQSRFVLKTALE